MADPRNEAEAETPDPELDETEVLDEEETEETEEEEPDELEAEAEQPEPEPEEEPQRPPQQPPKPQSRAARRIQSLTGEVKTLKRQLGDLQRRPAAPDPAAAARQEQQEREAEERVLLTNDPAQISRFFAERETKKADQRLNGALFHMLDANDRSTFELAAQRNTALASVADEVEERLATARQQGMNPQRVAIARMILGERLEKRAGAAKTRQTTRATARNQRQVARPGNPRGDVQTSRRQSADTHAARAKRLDESGLL